MGTSASKHIVITGSTRGIGYGLADAFLHLGYAVMVSGRNREGTELAVSQLAAKYDAERIFSVACDVTIPAEVKHLWDQALARRGERFGSWSAAPL